MHGRAGWSQVRTFTYLFGDVAAEVDCHELALDGTPTARSGWFRGGGLQGRQSLCDALAGGGDGASRALAEYERSSPKNNLEPGGAVAPPSVKRESEDCQVPSRWVCLSQRGGAAGPERSRAPCAPILALGQRLEQLLASTFASFRALGPPQSEPPSSLHAPRAHESGATPVISCKFETFTGRDRTSPWRSVGAGL